ncbi:MAG: sugar phosphate isomerase/epimerase family protein [Clostridia bacterium]
MDIALSTASFYPSLLTEDALVKIAELGLQKAEVFLESMSEYRENFGEILEERKEEAGLEVYSVHSLCSQFEPQLFAATERQRQDALEVLKGVFRVARMLGARVYVFHGPANIRRRKIRYDYERLGRITGELANLAGEFGLKFSWENVDWCYFNHPAFANKLLENCPHDNLAFTLDIKQAMLAGYDPFDFLEAMGNRVVNVHVCDFDQDGKLLLPGKGCFDFHRLKAELSRIGYGGPVVVEVYRDNYRSYDELMECCHRLRGIFTE